jgi:hypothetical protein
MYIRHKLVIPLLMLLASILSACRSGPKFVAPEIEPPADLIPAYMPKEYKCISGFQIAPETTFPAPSNGDEGAFFGRLRESRPYFDLKSPNGNDIQGVYYQGKDDLIHTPRGGRVTIFAKRSADKSGLEISVSDTGAGLSPEELTHIFKRFNRADGVPYTDQSRTGLGLAIVKAIVEAHGGSVSAQSAGKDQGSTFTIRLPSNL